MALRIAVLKETPGSEQRVAATPETVAKYRALGMDVFVEAGAGLGSGFLDGDYASAGATLSPNPEAATNGADIVLAVRRPPARALGGARGALVIALMEPHGNEADIQALANAGVRAIAMELIPRITRAQSMDVLSSQASLAGYRAVIDAASAYGRAFPMMMTAAGTVPAARVFVMGAGVAGLQAIATARRLGAVVSATDVRPAAREQVESLGGKFIAVQDDEFKAAETAGGYAREMSADYRIKQAELVASHIAKQDIVITTALIPGRPAPRLVTKAMVESLRPGSIIVDLAVERGGNVELSQPDTDIDHKGVRILGLSNAAGRLASTASSLYARNLLSFVTPLIDTGTASLAVNWDDELIKATLLTRDGAVVHPAFAGGSEG
jgi:H+-translocating NAD(P) transhydrogenase subunit alpha